MSKARELSELADTLTVDGSGNVGLGTTSPASTLTVNNTTKSEIRIDTTGGANADSELAFYENGVDRASFYWDGVDNDLYLETTAGDFCMLPAGNVGIGTTSPSATLTVLGTNDAAGGIALTSSTSDATLKIARVKMQHYTNAEEPVTLMIGAANSGANTIQIGGGSGAENAATDIQFLTASNTTTTTGTERMRIDNSGNVGIGTASPNTKIDAVGSTTTSSGIVDTLRLRNTGTAAGDGAKIQFTSGASSTSGAGIGSGGVALNSADLRFYSGGNTERMRIDASGNLLVGKTGATFTTAGIELGGDRIVATRSGAASGAFNRLTNDGNLVEFYQASTLEGTISVSGTTVSYNGGHLARWSRLPAEQGEPTLYKGTVMTNLDTMVNWETEAVPATYWEEGDELPEGVSVGDIKTEAIPAGQEDNEQLNETEVSSVEGDPNVAGLFVAWDESDELGDYYLAMTGDLVIRIAQGVTVQRGDLLMSAGDGTAKPQGDDIVRSKTIAKVTSTNVSHTYPDGSYAVPCVVMAC